MDRVVRPRTFPFSFDVNELKLYLPVVDTGKKNAKAAARAEGNRILAI